MISWTYLTVAVLAPTFLEMVGATCPADKVPMPCTTMTVSLRFIMAGRHFFGVGISSWSV